MANLQAVAWAGGLQLYAVAENVYLVISHGQPAAMFSPSLQTIQPRFWVGANTASNTGWQNKFNFLSHELK